jgi:gliding motility-associated-like protein
LSSKALLISVFRICIFLIPVLNAGDLNAQIFSSTSEKEVPIKYPVDTSVSKVFIFYSHPGEVVHGGLYANLPSAGNYDFEWFQYNNLSGNFDIPLFSQSGVSLSQINNLTGGGYQVRIRNGIDTDTSFNAWIHIDKLFASVEKDNQGKLKQTDFTCDYLTLRGAVSIDTFYYYDPLSHNPVLLKNSYKFKWTSDNVNIGFKGNDTIILDPNTTYSPPYLDTWYILTATDRFGMEDVDSVLYESIQVKPLFSFKQYDPKEAKDFIDAKEPAEGDAPLKVKFINESINGFSYEWVFSDSARSDFFANEITNELAYQPEYMYKIPNIYYPALVVTSEAGCVDSFKLDQGITVLPSLLEVPNVFSPDGDGTNDFFTVKFQSIKEFSLRVYDRAGKMVYKAEISDMYTWKGWDGKVLDSEREATPGAYFYVIEATGWDKKFYHRRQYRGVVYLFREAK